MDGVLPPPNAGLRLSNRQLNTLVNHAPTSQLGMVLGRPFKGTVSLIRETRTGPVSISGSIKCRSLLDANGLHKKPTGSEAQRVRVRRGPGEKPRTEYGGNVFRLDAGNR